jgi:hypothetical protein
VAAGLHPRAVAVAAAAAAQLLAAGGAIAGRGAHLLPSIAARQKLKRFFPIVRVLIRIHKFTIPHNLSLYSKERQVRLQNFCISNYKTKFNIIFPQFFIIKQKLNRYGVLHNRYSNIYVFKKKAS